MWGLASSKYGKNNIKLYIYKPDRKYDNAKEILDGYHGYVFNLMVMKPTKD